MGPPHENQPRTETGTRIRSKALLSLCTRTRPIGEEAFPFWLSRPCFNRVAVRGIQGCSGLRSPRSEAYPATGWRPCLSTSTKNPSPLPGGQCDQQLPNAGASILEGVGSALGDQNGVAITQVLNLSRAPEAELAGENPEQLLLPMMHMHWRASTGRDILNPMQKSSLLPRRTERGTCGADQRLDC